MASGLSDMEDLLGRVSDNEIVDFMREAFVCYGAGAYRACIVLTFIAVFEDLKKKVDAIATPSNAPLYAVATDVAALAAGQKPFENQLVERLRAVDAITELQAQRLKQIIDHRNKAAHPSGLHASAEEARYVYFEAVDKFLSQRVLSTTHAADSLIEQLKQPNFFPSVSILEIANVADEEIQNIHPTGYDYLVIRLVKAVESADSNQAKNARLLLTALAAGGDTGMADLLFKRLVKPKSADNNYFDIIFTCCAANPDLVRVADAVTISRQSALFASATDATSDAVSLRSYRHPVQLVESLATLLREPAVLTTLNPFVDKVIEKYGRVAALAPIALGIATVKPKLLKVYYDGVGSSDYGTANRFANLLPDVDQAFASHLTDAECLHLLALAVRGANWGAFGLLNLRDTRFASLPKVAARARAAITGDPPGSDQEVVNLGAATDSATFLANYL
jgi:hypothetical protein